MGHPGRLDAFAAILARTPFVSRVRPRGMRPKTRDAGGYVRGDRQPDFPRTRAEWVRTFTMQLESMGLTLAKGSVFSVSLPATFASASMRRSGRPPMRHRGESWSIQLKRAQRPGIELRQPFAPFARGSAAENNQHAKQNASRCGASGGNPGGRGKGQPRRGI